MLSLLPRNYRDILFSMILENVINVGEHLREEDSPVISNDLTWAQYSTFQQEILLNLLYTDKISTNLLFPP